MSGWAKKQSPVATSGRGRGSSASDAPSPDGGAGLRLLLRRRRRGAAAPPPTRRWPCGAGLHLLLADAQIGSTTDWEGGGG